MQESVTRRKKVYCSEMILSNSFKFNIYGIRFSSDSPIEKILVTI